jgi:hypothetical protein
MQSEQPSGKRIDILLQTRFEALNAGDQAAQERGYAKAGQESYPGYSQARGRGDFAAPGRPGAAETQAKYGQPGQGLPGEHATGHWGTGELVKR